MTTGEYILTVLQEKKEGGIIRLEDEALAYDAAQLISGSFTSPLMKHYGKTFMI